MLDFCGINLDWVGAENSSTRVHRLCVTYNVLCIVHLNRQKDDATIDNETPKKILVDRVRGRNRLSKRIRQYSYYPEVCRNV